MSELIWQAKTLSNELPRNTVSTYHYSDFVSPSNIVGLAESWLRQRGLSTSELAVRLCAVNLAVVVSRFLLYYQDKTFVCNTSFYYENVTKCIYHQNVNMLFYTRVSDSLTRFTPSHLWWFSLINIMIHLFASYLPSYVF